MATRLLRHPALAFGFRWIASLAFGIVLASGGRLVDSGCVDVGGGSVLVRRAVAGDAAGIARVHVSSWRGAYAGLMPAELLAAQSVERRTEQWSEMLGRDGLTFVAELDQTVVGFAHAGKSRDADLPEVAELYAIYADPSVWDRRVGHALHDAVLDALRAGGFDRCLLWVLEGNQRAIGFYERHGWVADGRTKDDVRDGVTLVERRYLLDL